MLSATCEPVACSVPIGSTLTAAWVAGATRVGSAISNSTERILCSISVFFFQAEDGIRDVAVTGVQTCALPISRNVGLPGAHEPDQHDVPRHLREGIAIRREVPLRLGQRIAAELLEHPARKHERRSEERRVGKECRSRWSPYH